MLFEVALALYVDGVQNKINDTFSKEFPLNDVSVLVTYRGKRYIKIVNQRNGKDSSVFAFIDKNGDILKPASWNAPAKHARGNIFDPDNGLSRTRWTGPEYLR